MEYLTVRVAADKANLCLDFIEASVRDNDGVSLVVEKRLAEAKEALTKLHDSLPNHMLAKTDNDYICLGQNKSIAI